KRLMQRLHATLRDGGYLFLGHAETLWQISDEFSLVSLGDAFLYRRQAADGDRRPVLPDRRTEDEPRPTRADRRRGPLDRRRIGLGRRRHEDQHAEPVDPAAATVTQQPDPLVAVRTA